MRNVASGFIVGAILMLVPPPVATQSRTGPPGSVRGFFGGAMAPNPAQTSQQVSTWFDFGGGVDDNIGSASEAPDATPGSFDQTATGSFRYWRGRTTRSFETQARVYRTTSQAVEAALGGEVTLAAHLGVGRRNGGNATLRVANESARLFGAFGSAGAPVSAPDENAVPLTDVSPPQGIVENRWIAVNGNLNAFHNWTPRQRTTVQYSQIALRPREGQTLDSDTRGVIVQHEWSVRRSTALIGTYRFDSLDQTFGELSAVPLRVQALEGGIRFDKSLSPVRSFSIAVTGGVTQIMSVSSALAEIEGQFEPRASVAVGYNLARQWLVSGTVDRGMATLPGVSLDAFNNDVATVTLNGIMARRVTLALNTTWSRGTGVGVGASSFEASSSSATLQYGLRYGGLFVGVMRYQHELRQIANLPGVIPQNIDRYSVRGGVTLWLPLYGAF